MSEQPLSLCGLQSLLRITQNMQSSAERQDWDLVLQQDEERLLLLNTNCACTDAQGSDPERKQLRDAIQQIDTEVQAMAVKARNKHALTGADQRARQAARQGYLNAQSLVGSRYA
ncbi:MAG: hypothetical protein V3U76_08175 [Granulosicoccus sp.]